MKMTVNRLLILILLVLVCKSDGAGEPEGDITSRINPVKKARHNQSIENGARRWTQRFLSKKYLPPENTRYVFIPYKKESDVDILRMRYSIDDMTITLTQTLCLFHITITDDSFKDFVDHKELVRKYACEVFESCHEVSFFADGLFKADDLKTAPWLGDVQWFVENDTIIFSFIKVDNRPSAMVKGGGIEMNKSWFEKSN